MLHSYGKLTPSELERLLGWLPENICEAVASLTVRQRECIVLIFVDGHTEEEAAAKMGISQSHVNRHKSMAIQKLKEMFHK
jgi:RNA polymerase sigma factor (sigma-70 family)